MDAPTAHKLGAPPVAGHCFSCDLALTFNSYIPKLKPAQMLLTLLDAVAQCIQAGTPPDKHEEVLEGARDYIRSRLALHRSRMGSELDAKSQFPPGRC